ncbi:ATP-binding cassette domain-containing protein [Actinoplanes regularis]|uniref:ATP-binding cassette domain-containing protein n=1 Tax=Actinoplanes regularis TaxID=52697 RepID=UPI001EF29E30|nr:ATP-binding cassette domain-containing protein [Actinoplanes regularis]
MGEAEPGGPESGAPGTRRTTKGPIDPRLLRHARSARAGIALLAAIGAGQAAATLAIAVALTWIVAPSLSRSVLFGGTRAEAILLLAGAFAVRGLLCWAEQVTARRAAARVTDELRRSLLAAIVGRGPAWVASYGAGRLTTILGTGLDSLRPWFSGYLPSLVLGVLLPPAVIVLMALVDPASAVIALVMLPLVPLLGTLIGWATQARARQRWAADARLAGHFLDVVRGLGTLRMYGRAERQVEVIADLTDRHRRATLRVLRVAFLSSTALDLVGTLSVGLIAVQAGIRVAGGSMSLAPALLTILLAPEAYRPLREMAARYHASTDASAVIADVDEILTAAPVGAMSSTGRPDRVPRSAEWAARVTELPADRPTGVTTTGTSYGTTAGSLSPNDTSHTTTARPNSPDNRTEAASGTSQDAVTANAAFDAILASCGCYVGVGRQDRGGVGDAAQGAARWGVLAAGLRASYPGAGVGALRLDELAVRAGEIVALRGPSGAGKSTALRVLAGLHPAEAGAVAVGRAFHLSQRPALPHARTVGEAFPADAGTAEIRSALRLVGLDTEVTAKTPLGEHGNGVSAGQRQRLALAALLHRAGRAAALTQRAGRAVALSQRAGQAVALSQQASRAAGLSQRTNRVIARSQGVSQAAALTQRAGQVTALGQRPDHVTALTQQADHDTAPSQRPDHVTALTQQADHDTAPSQVTTLTQRAGALSRRADERPYRDEPGPRRRPLPVVTLLLDEPTAHLDPAAEALVVTRLREFAQRGCAVLVVAHRPALLAAADRVVDVHPPTSSNDASPETVGTDSGTQPAGKDTATRAVDTDTCTRAVDTDADMRAVDTAARTQTVDTDTCTRAADTDADTRPVGTDTRTRVVGTDAGTRAVSRWRRPWVAVALGAGSLLAGILLTGSAAWLLVRAVSLPPVLTLSTAVVLVRGSAVARPLLRYLERLVAHDVAFARLGSRRARVYADLIPRVPGPRLHRRGDLLTRLVDDVDARVDGLLRGWLPALAAGVAVVVAGAAAIAVAGAGSAAGMAGADAGSTAGTAGVGAGSALGIAGALVLGVLISGVVAPMVAGWQADRQDTATGAARAALRDAMVETVDGVEELGAGAGRAGVPEERSRALAVLEARAARTSGIAAAIAHLGWAVAAAGTALALGGSAISAEWSAVLLLGVIALGEPVVALPEAAIARRRAAGAERRVAALTADMPAAGPATRSTASLPAVDGSAAECDPGSVVLSGLVAGWDPAAGPALDGVDLVLPPGAKVAITGRSGSGKSTLGAVLGGLLPARAGEVRVGGKAVLVGDETGHVFASTVRENLRLAAPASSDPQLLAALRRVGLGSWLATLPSGLDSWLGTGGGTMSGGQRRRFATARALLAEPALLILDEPTEGIDEAGARDLMADLLDAASGRTVLIFAHRVEGLDLVDQVYELSRGRLNVGLDRSVL